MNSLTRRLFVLVIGGLLLHGLSLAEDGWFLGEDEKEPQGNGSIIKRFVDPLTRRENRPMRSMLTSDGEHASSIGPVLSPGIPVYVRTHQTREPTSEQQNLVLADGRIFVNYDDPFDPNKTPILKIRPVDGKTRIPFLVRGKIVLTGEVQGQSAIYLFVRLPAIFSPQFELRRAFLGTQKLEARVTTGSEDGTFTVHIPLESIEGKQNARKSLELVMEGSLVLNDYQVLPPSEFELSTTFDDPPLRNLARPLLGRDYLSAEELALLTPLADQVRAQTKNQYEQIRLALRLVSSKLSYYQNNMQRTAMQALVEGIGDCDDFSRLMVCLLRALGIPSRMAIGYLYDFNNMGPHAWVEAALMTKNHKPHWFICDPTLASASPDKDYFIQFKNRIYLYSVRFDIKAQNLAAEMRNEVLLNWSEKESLDDLPPLALSAVVSSFDQTLEASFKDQASQLMKQNLVLPRQFMFTPGAGYVLVDHSVTPDRSHLQLILDSDERVTAELTVTDDDFGLEAPTDLQVLTSLRDAYQNLKQGPFEGSEARHCLELSFYRDRYSDRLQRVRLRVSRYLVENHLRSIVGSFRKASLLTDEEAQRVISLHQNSSGKNLYFLQEMARRMPPLPVMPAPSQEVAPPTEMSVSKPPEP